MVNTYSLAKIDGDKITPMVTDQGVNKRQARLLRVKMQRELRLGKYVVVNLETMLGE